MPIQLLRVLLGILALFFAYALGRMITRLRRAKQPYTKALTWALRTTVCLFGVLWNRGLDATSVTFLVLCAGTFALGSYVAGKPPRVEESHLIR